VARAGIAAFLVAAGLVLVGVAVPAAPASADEAWSQDLWYDLMSPYCPGRTLADCPSPQAQELRAWIAEQEKQGRSREDVESQLYRLYGDVILSAPRAEGWGLAAYGVPVAAFLLGGALLAVFLRRQSRSAPEPAAAAEARPDPELERIVDEELRNAAQ
jgi:cytochrome c-type biogenesis protein CcmH/NrfF